MGHVAELTLPLWDCATLVVRTVPSLLATAVCHGGNALPGGTAVGKLAWAGQAVALVALAADLDIVDKHGWAAKAPLCSGHAQNAVG